ncbi:hypothetical protein [Flavobacteriaceae bacterium 14752]|uniref:hypothetical protein n=1 Tax=Mesohalobacter salilacus TaxID=2491711 RepID=UPI000F636972|nr:hypothetical protein EIG84_00315 [Flavobacteriaceae bacterium 14752]
MNKTIIILIFLIPIIGFCQEQDFDINKISLSDYLKKEKEYVGGKILDSDFQTTKKELGLISYIRSDGSVEDVDLIVRYIFFKQDSLIKEIRNEWDIANHNEKLDNKKDIKFRTDLMNFYLILEQNLEKNYGKGIANGKILKNLNDKDTYSKEIKWTFENTIVKLNILMSNIYDKKKNIFPTHKIYLSLQAKNLENKPDYGNKELIKRKVIPDIENPIINSAEPTFPDCENSKEKISCMNNKIRDLVIKRLEQENIQITNDTLKVGFMVKIDGKVKPWESSIKSNNKELEKVGLETIKSLPRMIPSYSERIKKNVSYGNSFFIIIENNKVRNYE